MCVNEQQAMGRRTPVRIGTTFDTFSRSPGRETLSGAVEELGRNSRIAEGRQTRLLCRSGARAEGGFYAEPASRPGYQRAGSSDPWQPMIELPGLPVLLGCGPTLRASGSGGS